MCPFPLSPSLFPCSQAPSPPSDTEISSSRFPTLGICRNFLPSPSSFGQSAWSQWSRPKIGCGSSSCYPMIHPLETRVPGTTPCGPPVWWERVLSRLRVTFPAGSGSPFPRRWPHQSGAFPFPAGNLCHAAWNLPAFLSIPAPFPGSRVSTTDGVYGLHTWAFLFARPWIKLQFGWTQPTSSPLALPHSPVLIPCSPHQPLAHPPALELGSAGCRW